MASRCLNRVILIGNLTRDPELKYTANGVPVCTFGVATNRSWTTNEGQTKEETQYHRIVAWQKLAELCSKILTKGRKIYLEGRLSYRTFTGQDNLQHTIAEIILDDFIVFNDGKRTPIATEEKKAEEETISQEIKKEEEEEVLKEKEEEKKEKTNELEDKTEDINPDDIPF